MVKISDSEAAHKYNIINAPSLVYFRKRVPLIYDGRYKYTNIKIYLHVAVFYNLE